VKSFFLETSLKGGSQIGVRGAWRRKTECDRIFRPEGNEAVDSDTASSTVIEPKRNERMQHYNRKMGFLLPALVFTLCFSLVAPMTVAQGYAAEKAMKGAEPGQGQAQQMSPPKSPAGTCGPSTCTVPITSPPLKSEGKPVSQANVNSPAKPEKGKKTR
jgi:hypothetical protein